MLEDAGAEIYRYLSNTGIVDYIQPRLPELTSTVRLG